MAKVGGLDVSTGTGPKTDAIGAGGQMLGIKPKSSFGGEKPVDPMTGQEMQTPEQSYFSKLFYTGLANTPSAKVSLGFTNFRATNTILSGSFDGANNMAANWPKGRKSFMRLSSTEGFRPKGAVNGAETSPGLLDFFKKDPEKRPKSIGSVMKGNREGYSPFNMSDFINSAATKLESGEYKIPFTGKTVGIGGAQKRATIGPRRIAVDSAGDATVIDPKKSTRMTSWLRDKGVLSGGEGSEQTLFGRGGLAHFSAGSKIGMKSGPIGEKTAESMNKAFRASRDMLDSGAGGIDVVSAEMSGREAGMKYMMNTAEGSIGSRMTGYAAGARFGKIAMTEGPNEIAKKSAGRAVEHLALGGMEKDAAGKLVATAGNRLGLEAGERVTAGLAAKAVGRTVMEVGGTAGVEAGARIGLSLGVEAAGLAIPFVNVAMAAWMAYDVAKLGIQLIKQTPDLIREGAKSFKGQIDKRPMGMGFQDNSVAMTSRQRGVMAISNSRLNARSVVGSEASMMAQHYG